MTPIEKLAQLFKEFPGIGERQAKRFVYFLLTKDSEYLEHLTKEISELKNDISECILCHRFFSKQSTNHKVCDLCERPGIDRSTIIIVEKDADVEALRKSNTYKGYYFVLGGAIPVLEKIPEERVRIKALKNRIKELSEEELSEIILAFSITPSGLHTEDVIRSTLDEIVSNKNIKIVNLGRGLSTGTELEYADPTTIKEAIKNRH